MGLDKTRSPSERAETPLTAAILAGRWIRTAARDDAAGRTWAANPDARGRSALAAPDPASLYAGAAGIVLFFLERGWPGSPQVSHQAEKPRPDI